MVCWARVGEMRPDEELLSGGVSWGLFELRRREGWGRGG